MKVMYLSPYGQEGMVPGAIRWGGDQLIPFGTKVDFRTVDSYRPDWLVTYGYRHMISPEILDLVGRERTVNIHISLLPHNKGAYPNLWSWIDGTPHGVTLHQISDELDSGPIWHQQAITFAHPEHETLASTYWTLRKAAEFQFDRIWSRIRNGIIGASPTPQGGSSHSLDQGKAILAAMPDGWNTTIGLVQEIGAEIHASAQFFTDPAPAVAHHQEQALYA